MTESADGEGASAKTLCRSDRWSEGAVRRRLTQDGRNAPHDDDSHRSARRPLGYAFRSSRESAATALDRPVRLAAVRRGARRAFPPCVQRCDRGECAPRSRRSKPIPNPPASRTRFSRWSARAARSDRVAAVFFHLVGADTNDEIQAIEREIAPILARERNAVYLDDALFQRVDAVYASRDGRGLDSEAVRLIERYRLAFVRSGAGLPADKKARLAEIGERLATLGATFGQNVLADEKDFLLVLEQPEDLVGAARGVSRPGRADGDRTRPSRQTCGHALAFLDRAVPAILGQARSPGEGVPGVRRARGERRRARQRRRHERDGAAARGKGAPSRLRDFRGLSPRRHDGEDARGGAGPAPIRSGRRRARRRCGTPRRCRR